MKQSEIDGQQWYCLIVAPHKEFAVAKLLREAGHSTFLPTETKWRRASSHCRRRVPTIYPLLLRYVIVGFAAGETPWYHLATIWHFQAVIGLVCFNGVPARIGAAEVQRLAMSYGCDLPKSAVAAPHKSFAPGDKALIWEGAFAGRSVEIAAIRGRNAEIVLELFGSKQTATIPVANLEAA